MTPVGQGDKGTTTRNPDLAGDRGGALHAAADARAAGRMVDEAAAGQPLAGLLGWRADSAQRRGGRPGVDVVTRGRPPATASRSAARLIGPLAPGAGPRSRPRSARRGRDRQLIGHPAAYAARPDCPAWTWVGPRGRGAGPRGPGSPAQTGGRGPLPWGTDASGATGPAASPHALRRTARAARSEPGVGDSSDNACGVSPGRPSPRARRGHPLISG